MKQAVTSGRSGRYAAIGAAVVIAAAIAAVLLLPGQQPAGQPRNAPPKIAVVTDAQFADRGWGASALSASKFIQSKYSANVTAVDNVAIADIESTLIGYAKQNYDLIIAHGFQWGDPALRVGKQYPNTKIVVFTGLVKSENVASIFPMQQQGSFLLGALAGMMTKTNVVGFVGGEEYPNVVNIFEGYRQGAMAANPDVKVVKTYLNDWDNELKGKEAASSLIVAGGADVVFHVADTSGHGVIAAAQERRVYALGAVQDQNPLAPGAVLSSFVLDTDKAYDQAVQMFLAGKFKGEIFKPGIESGKSGAGDGIVYLAPFHELDSSVSQQVKEKMGALEEGIINGTLVVPERYD